MTDWLLTRKARPDAKYRLICIPNAGAGMMVFWNWADALPFAEVSLAHLPGRDDRRDEPIAASIHDVADQLATALTTLRPLPIVLFGHSMGALIAFEVARRLKSLPAPPVAGLVVSGRRGPRTPRRFPPLAHLPEDAFVDEVQRRYGALPDVILQDDDLRSMFLPTLRADMHMVDAYEPGGSGTLSCPIFAYGGTDDAQTSETELTAWRGETSGTYARRWFDGGHFFLDSARAAVLTALRQDLDSLFGIPGAPR